MDKSPEAFRTISEVADFLDTPAHVLRFWESRFPQIRPVKRAGGRRYYRPGDVALLSGIKKLLHDEGMTIRGVQKILREQGIRHVASLGSGDAATMLDDADIEAVLSAEYGPRDRVAAADAIAPEAMQTAQIISLETALNRQDAPRETTPEQADLWPLAAPDSPAEDTQAWPSDPGEVVSVVDEAERSEQMTAETFAAAQTPPEGDDPANDGPSTGVPSSDQSIPADIGGDDAGSVEVVAEVGSDRAGESVVSDEPDSGEGDGVIPVATLLRRCSANDVAAVQPQLIMLRDRLTNLRARVADAARRKAK